MRWQHWLAGIYIWPLRYWQPQVYDTSGNLILKHKADSIRFSGFVSPIFSGFGSQILLPSTRLRHYKLQIEFGSLWIDDARISISFGNNGKKTIFQEIKTTSSWRPQAKIIDDYDQNGFYLGNTWEQYDDISGRLELSYGTKSIPFYSPNNTDVVEVINQYYNGRQAANGWVNSTRYIYSNHTQFTSLSPTSKIEPLHLYPNPTSNSFKVEANSGSLLIRNAIGQTVYTQELDGQTISPNLRAGVYVVNVVEEGKTVRSSKLIIQ